MGRFSPVVVVVIAALVYGCTGVQEQRTIRPAPSGQTTEIGSAVRVVKCEPTPDAQKRKLEGICAIVKDGGVEIVWSYPETNDRSKLPATVAVNVKLSCLRANNIEGNRFVDSATLVVDPGQTRLVGGKFFIPKAMVNFSDYAEGADVSWAFNNVTWTATWSGLIVEKGPLSFELAGEKDGVYNVKWTARGQSDPVVIIATADNVQPVILNTAIWKIRVTCTLIDNVGKVFGKDEKVIDGKKGEFEVSGWFGVPKDKVYDIDWTKSSVLVERFNPDAK